jgi:hypothetical protein
MSSGIDSEESILPGWESIPGLLERFANTGFGSPRSIRSVFSGWIKKNEKMLWQFECTYIDI